MPGKGGKLTDKQRRFVAEYLKDANGTQAAIRAGFSQKTAGTQAGRLLKNVHVAAAVASGQHKLEKSVEITKAEAVKIMAGLLRTKAKRVSARDKVAIVGRLAAMCGWDEATKIHLTQEEAILELAGYLGMKPEELAGASVH